MKLTALLLIAAAPLAGAAVAHRLIRLDKPAEMLRRHSADENSRWISRLEIGVCGARGWEQQ